MQKVQLKLITDEVLEFKTESNQFSKEVQECYQNDFMLEIKIMDEDDDTVLINPKNILYARFKDI